jgi:hypothetical protein
MCTISFCDLSKEQLKLPEIRCAISSVPGRFVPPTTGIRSVYLIMHPVIREISPAPVIISLIPSLICGQPGYGGGIVRDSASASDPQVQRQKTSSTGDREKECGGGWFIAGTITDGLLFYLCCCVPGINLSATDMSENKMHNTLHQKT